MKKGLITSFLATAIVGALAFFFNAPKKIVKSKDKTYKNKFLTQKEDPNNLFI